MAKVIVEGYNHLIRDTSSNAIVNTSTSDYSLYMQRHRQIRENKDEMRNAIREINNLKKELREIKELLVKKVNN
jgi:di/tripeptidase